jgi:hypothetical protein
VKQVRPCLHEQVQPRVHQVAVLVDHLVRQAVALHQAPVFWVIVESDVERFPFAQLSGTPIDLKYRRWRSPGCKKCSYDSTPKRQTAPTTPVIQKIDRKRN